jgi:uncharacterized membrane protein YidH (DUF202 family)
LLRVLKIHGVLFVGGNVCRILGIAVVVAGMAEAERVSDLMQEREQRTAFKAVILVRRVDVIVAVLRIIAGSSDTFMNRMSASSAR